MILPQSQPLVISDFSDERGRMVVKQAVIEELPENHSSSSMFVGLIALSMRLEIAKRNPQEETLGSSTTLRSGAIPQEMCAL